MEFTVAMLNSEFKVKPCTFKLVPCTFRPLHASAIKEEQRSTFKQPTVSIKQPHPIYSYLSYLTIKTNKPKREKEKARSLHFLIL